MARPKKNDLFLCLRKGGAAQPPRGRRKGCSPQGKKGSDKQAGRQHTQAHSTRKHNTDTDSTDRQASVSRLQCMGSDALIEICIRKNHSMIVNGKKMMLSGKGSLKPDRIWKPKPNAASE